MVKSKYQLKIHEVFTNTMMNILVSAVAGSGKSTTLIQLLELCRGTVIFMAFNKSIVEELQQKTGYDKDSVRVQICTFHSLGMRSLMSHFNKHLKVEKNKTWGILEILNKKWKVPKKNFPALAMVLCKLYDIYRIGLCRNVEDIKEVADEMGVEWDESQILKMVKVIAMMESYNTNPDKIDFIDMIYLPVVKQVELPTPDNLFIDEAQDLNSCQHAMINAMKIKGRTVVVGDRSQAIYGFAGADAQSFDRFKGYPNTVELPLSVCYRCGTRIVDQARKINSEIEPFMSNPSGLVKIGKDSEIRAGDMVICRNVKPLIRLFFKLINRDIKAHIKGEDIGKGLIQLISPHIEKTLDNLNAVFKDKLQERVKELQEREIEDPKKHPSYRNLFDKIEIILLLSSKFETVKELKKFFEKVFTDRNESNSVVLSTIHKSKGLENDRIFILDRNLIPSEFAKTEKQLEQERNLLYVAITRAKSELIFIKSVGVKMESNNNNFENKESINNGKVRAQFFH